jgi:Glycosyl transferase family group 2
VLDTHPDARIVQQSAVFTRSLGAGLLTDGAAMLQSRWTLAREIPRLRRQAAYARTPPARAGGVPPLAHCVGHGLFIRADTFSRLGGLPTATMNEDLAFGYLACASGTPIDPLPVLEVGDSPPTAAGVIRQARQWFWSYPQYPAAARLAARAGLGTRRDRVLLAAQGLARGALWLGQSPAVVLAVTLPATARHKTALAATTGALAAYYGVPFAALARHLRHAGADVPCGPRELLGGLSACLASSAGPWWCLSQAARARITGARYLHGKTER